MRLSASGPQNNAQEAFVLRMASMSKVRKIINNTRLQGFVWKIVQGENELRRGAANSRVEAEAQADAALKELQANE
jgi:hypothetical protein